MEVIPGRRECPRCILIDGQRVAGRISSTQMLLGSERENKEIENLLTLKIDPRRSMFLHAL